MYMLIVVVAAVHIHMFVRDRQVGLNHIHLFFCCELENVGAKEMEVGYEAGRDDEGNGGHMSSDNEGG